jgi:hypothetical protein
MEGIAGVLADFETVDCPRCSKPFGRRRGSDADVCADCAAGARIAAEAEAVLAEPDRYVSGFLRRAGLSTRELTARTVGIPAAVAAVLKQGAVGRSIRLMQSGEVPPAGFGISGPTGCGKSFALASILRDMVERRLLGRVRTFGRKAFNDAWLAWVSWPEAATKFRRMAARGDGALDDVEREVSAMAQVPVLVLDDLGVERFRGADYSDDWLASQLDALIDERYNEMRPTWYTTNLAAAEFAERYGARMTSRLVSENPLVRVQPGPDLRLARRS